jgi:putative redox protein
MLTSAAGGGTGPGPAALRTVCGRDLRVGRLALGCADRPWWRISLDIGQLPGNGEGTWAGLTPAEARALAAALLVQAEAVERNAPAARTAVAKPALPGDTGRWRAAVEPAPAVTVSHTGGESYAIAVRDHVLRVDQPVSAGGADSAPTPTELLVASLASCVAFYAGRYLDRHGLSRAGLGVTAEFTMAQDRPARVGELRLSVQVPGGVPAGRQAGMLAVISHCTVHNTLHHQPSITIGLVTPPTPAS